MGANSDNLDFSVPPKCLSPHTLNYKFAHHLSLTIMTFEMNNKIWKHAEGLIWDCYFWCSFTHFCYHLMFYDKPSSPSVHHENHDKCKRLTWTWHPVGFLFIFHVLTFRIHTVITLRKLYRIKRLSGIPNGISFITSWKAWTEIRPPLCTGEEGERKGRGYRPSTSRPSRQGPLPNLPPMNTDTNWEVYEK